MQQGQRLSLRLQQRDKDIIKAVYLCRALLPDQINALFFTPDERQDNIEQIEVSSNCRKRLEKLTEYNYLHREKRHSVFELINPPYLYFLQPQSLPLLAEDFGISQKNIDWKLSSNDMGDGFLKHLVDNNYVRVAIDIAARTNGFSIPIWISDTQLRKEQRETGEQITIVGPNGRLVKKALIPDAHFQLDAGGYEYFNFIEVDRGNESVSPEQPHSSNLATKIKLYLAYHQSGQYQRKYHTSVMRVLFILQGKRGTPGEVRLQNTKRVAEELGAGQQIWFTTLEQAKNPKAVLTQPIWQKAGQEGLFRLIW